MFRKLPLESDKDVERRSQAYTTCWTDIRQRIEVSRETLSVADRICVCMLASFSLPYKVNNSDKHKKSLHEYTKLHVGCPTENMKVCKTNPLLCFQVDLPYVR